MINGTLFKREMKSGLKLWLIFAAVITLYVICIIGFYDAETMKMLDGLTRAMPEIMAAVGMKAGATSLLGFMISYLYGFILLVFPMIFSILRSTGLLARYAERGSLTYLAAAPVKRSVIAFTQMGVLTVSLFLLVLYTTAVEFLTAQLLFPGECSLTELLTLNAGLLCLHLFIGAVCFGASCLFSDTRKCAVFGAGIPTLMYLFQMIANVSDKAEKIKYLSAFTLFDANGLIAGKTNALLCSVILLVGAVILYAGGISVFCRRDLHL